MAAPPAPVWQHMARRTTAHSQRLANVANVITRAALYARCASLPPLRTLAIRSPTRHHCGVERPPPLPLTLPHRLDRCPRRQTYRSRPRSERRTTTRFPTRRGCATTRTESACWCSKRALATPTPTPTPTPNPNPNRLAVVGYVERHPHHIQERQRPGQAH